RALITIARLECNHEFLKIASSSGAERSRAEKSRNRHVHFATGLLQSLGMTGEMRGRFANFFWRLILKPDVPRLFCSSPSTHRIFAAGWKYSNEGANEKSGRI